MNRKADFFLQIEQIRITNRIESIRVAIWNAVLNSGAVAAAGDTN